MPDQYGRWTLEDGLRIAQLGMQVQGNIRASEAAEREKETFEQQKQNRLQYDQYSALIQKGQEPEKVLQGTDINHRVLAKVKSDQFQAKLSDIQVRKGEFDLALAKAQDAKRQAIENISRAEAMESTGNPDLAIPYYIEAYKYINNGENIEYDSGTKKLHLLEPDETGTLQRGKEIPLPTREQMQMMARDVLDRNNFEQMYVSNRMKNRAINAAAVANPIKIVDASGAKVGWMAQGIDPDTGYPDWKVSLDDGRLISYSDAKKKGYTAEEEWVKTTKERLGLAKQQVEIEHERALGKKAGKEGRDVGVSPEEKLADFYVRAGRAKDLGDALDKIEQAKAKSDKFRLLMEEVRDPLSDVKIGTPLFEQRLRDLNLESYFPKETEKGSPVGYNPFGEEAEVPPIEGARKSPKDGKWYIQKNGKWYRVKEK